MTQAELKIIEIALNTRPRKILHFQTPDGVFPDLKLNEFLSVALQTCPPKAQTPPRHPLR